MIPDKKILRYHDKIGFYELSISSDVIESYKNNFDLNNRNDVINVNHTENTYSAIKILKSFLISDTNRQSLPLNFQDLPDGTWMLELFFEDTELLTEFENNGLKGFSIEGRFTIEDDKGKQITVYEKFRRMNKLSDLLSFDIWVHGGSTEGAGRNEHGEAHFELKEKKSHRPLGKIFMPTINKWLGLDFKQRVKLLNVQNGNDISQKEKKGFVRWLELNNNENLIKCHQEWNECNKDNNRTTQI